MEHLLKTCPLTQLMHIALWWQKKANFQKSESQNWPSKKGKQR